MITIEEATRSVDILIGVFMLAFVAMIGIYLFISDVRENKYKKDIRDRLDAQRCKLVKEFNAQLHQLKVDHFADRTDLKFRVIELEKELKQKELENKKLQSDFERLQDAVRRAENGQK